MRRLAPSVYVNLMPSTAFLISLALCHSASTERFSTRAPTRKPKPIIVKNQPETLAERLRVAMYLNSVAFNFDINNPPRMDRTVFSCRAHAEQSADNG